MFQELRFAIRGLLGRRAFSAVAITTLAVGIGATTAVYSLVDGVLLRPLPYEEPDRLFRVWQAFPEWRESEVLKARWNRVGLSYPQYTAIEQACPTVESITAIRGSTADFVGAAEPVKAVVGHTTASLLNTLGVGPVVGRDFSSADERQEDGPVALLAFHFWVNRFAGDASVVGRVVRIGSESFTIIGVAPPSVRLASSPDGTGGGSAPFDVYLVVDPASREARAGFGHSYEAIARLTAGATNSAAEADILPVLGEAYASYRPEDERPGVGLVALGEQEIAPVRRPLWILLAAAGIVLLVACGNVANLMVSEAVPRSRELALRAAIGAGRGCLLRLVLVESLALAAVGGLLGAGLGWAGVRWLVALAPPGIPNLDAVGIDARVLAVSTFLALLTGVLFGLVPALLASRTDIVKELKNGHGTTAPAAGRWQHAVSTAQVALAVVVLAGAWLLVQSLDRLLAVPLGFDPTGVLTMEVDLPAARYPDTAARVRFYDEARQLIAALPGVEAVTQTSKLPFRPARFSSNPIDVENRNRPLVERLETDRRFVLPNFFEVMRIPLVEGDGLPDDGGEACRIVIGETTARRLFPDGRAVGRRVEGARSGTTMSEEVCTVVGVAADVKDRGLALEAMPTYYSAGRGGEGGRVTLLVRTAGSPSTLAPAVRRIVRELDGEIPLGEAVAFEEVIERTIVADRYRAFLLAFFALVTLLLAAVGTYGVLANVVARQTRAFGIRLALGAQSSQIVMLVVRRAACIALAGVSAGVAVALAATRILSGFLFGIAATDAPTYIVAGGAVLIVTLASGWLPARRATLVDPACVLRR